MEAEESKEFNINPLGKKRIGGEEDPFGFFGLKKGATAKEMGEAFRRKVSEYKK